MKLIAKKGSDFEVILCDMYLSIRICTLRVNELLYKATGAIPSEIKYICGSGIIFKLVPEFVFSEDETPYIGGKCLRQVKRDKTWVPSLIYKEGKRLAQSLKLLSDEFCVTDKSLHKYGIYMENKAQKTSYSFTPDFDKEHNRFFLECPSDLPRLFSDNEYAIEQIEIEH